MFFGDKLMYINITFAPAVSFKTIEAAVCHTNDCAFYMLVFIEVNTYMEEARAKHIFAHVDKTCIVGPRILMERIKKKYVTECIYSHIYISPSLVLPEEKIQPLFFFFRKLLCISCQAIFAEFHLS